MQELVIQIIEQWGYIGVAFLIAVENIFPPIPSEVILAFGGFMTSQTTLNAVGVIVSATIGSTVGAIVLYLIGRILNKERLERIVSGKIGKVLRLKASDIEKADKWFDTKGQKTVFICRFIPIVRSLISIPAGMSEMNFLKFLLYTVLGSTIWNTVLVLLGKELGDSWERVVEVFDNFSHIILVVLIIVVAFGIFWFYKSKSKKKGKKKEEKE
mgnify:CR=1 FL=1